MEHTPFKYYQPVAEEDIDREVRLKNALKAWKRNEQKLEKLVPYAKQLEEENKTLKKQLSTVQDDVNSDANKELRKHITALNKKVAKYEKFIEETFLMRIARKKLFKLTLQEHQDYIAYLESVLCAAGVSFKKRKMNIIKNIETDLSDDFAIREKADIINKLQNFEQDGK